MNDKYFTCEIHQERFKTLQAIKEHDLQYHSENSIAEKQCQELFNKRLKKTNKKPSPNESNVASIISTKTESTSQQVEPIEPKASIISPASSEPLSNPVIKIDPDLFRDEDEELTQFQCNFCTQFVYGEVNLNLHIQSHVKEEANESVNDEETFENLGQASIDLEIKVKEEPSCIKPEQSIELEKSEIKTFNCKFCDARFSTSFLRKNHLTSEHFDKDFDFWEAKECGKATKSESQNDSIHKKTLKCKSGDSQYCNDYPRLMKRRTKNKHFSTNKEAKNSLDLSKDEFKREYILKALSNTSPSNLKGGLEIAGHSRTYRPNREKYHTPCYFCGMYLESYNSLERHMWRHTTERPYKCAVCNKAFRALGEVKRHSAYHNEARHFKCQICKCSFREKRTLDLHLLTHSDERSNSCAICDKSYKRASDLRRHIRTAHANVIFQCLYCRKSYNRKDVLKAHLRNRHGK